MEQKEQRKRLEILGTEVDMVDFRGAMDIFEKLMETPGFSMIVTPNSEIVLNAKDDKDLAELIRNADLVIPDGIGLVYASKILGEPLSERVTGVDFLTGALEYLAKTGKTAFLLGSKPETEAGPSVAELAAENMKKCFPELTIAGTHHGYFKPDDEEDIIDEINASGAEFLCVALGSPKQEKFMWSHRDRLKNIRACIGVGGSLDVWAGTAKRAPEFYQKHGLEWLYRLIQEPWRYKRMAKLPVFMLTVMTQGKRGSGKVKTEDQDEHTCN